MSQANTLKAVWASFPGSLIRHKVFVPHFWAITERAYAVHAAKSAAEALYHRGTLAQERFPVTIQIFTDPNDSEPVHTVTVDMDVRPIFFETGESST